jgi:hypothetical protein
MRPDPGARKDEETRRINYIVPATTREGERVT